MISQSDLKEDFTYDENTGYLYWRKVGYNKTHKLGKKAGGLAKDGYWKVKYKGKNRYLHVLIYIYHHGYRPEFVIDHINKNKLDNRIENLREETYSCNRINAIQNHNAQYIKGVIKQPKLNKYRANITRDGICYFLGYYDTVEEAVFARYAAEQCLGFDKCDYFSPAKIFVYSTLKKSICC